MEGTPTEGAAFVPTADDLAGIDAWFARYDALATAGDVEAMADMALFPLNLATDDAQGNGSAWQWTREQFVSGMGAAMGPEGPEGGATGVTMELTRTPHFLTPQLAIVVTDAVHTAGGTTHRLRYADLLVKRDGRWLFQTMVQGGWGGR